MERPRGVESPRRLLVVSGHYPPDFVSGGTLVAQTHARALRDRGWDVSVYAGALHSGRPDLDTWDSIDPCGVRIRWIGVAGFTSWNNPASYNNPAAVANFQTYLDVVRPDVVHLHNLQALGAGLIPAARAAGARVIVTAHDFWWWCARQFLCDKKLHPCALVSDLGDCACQVNARWRHRRALALLTSLSAAHAVLAPSRIAARVLVANGVDTDRVRVDENALDRVPSRGHSRAAASGNVRLLFVGGENPLKGLRVLLDALDSLADVPGWSAGLFGVTETAVAGRRARPNLRLMPPYPPDTLDEILGSHDVLVVPSLARESYSRITREALLSGLPVVTSDALGPEEVVEDWVNGHIVPSGDPDALTEVIHRLVVDRAWLERLRSARPPRVRDVGEQADGLEVLYRDLLATEMKPAPDISIAPEPVGSVAAGAPRRVLFVAGIHGAPLRYRTRHVEEALRLGGIETDAVYYRDPRVRHLMMQVDTVVLYRVPMTRQLKNALDKLRATRPGIPVIFDVDDLIIDEEKVRDLEQLGALPMKDRAEWFRGVRRYRETLRACDAATTSTPAIGRAITAAGVTAFVVPNGVGGVTARRSAAALTRPRKPGPLRLGYFSGTATHDHDWALIEALVADVLRARPDVRLWLVGHVTPGPALADVIARVDRVPFTDWTALPELLRDTDIGLAPLAPGEFADAKSAIKWLEAALVRTPTIASATEAFTMAIDHGRTGFLARTGDEWRQHLLTLLDDDALRDRIGRAAEREALLAYGPHVRRHTWLHAWTAAVRQAERGATAARPASSESLDDDRCPNEPSIPEPLEHYPFPSVSGHSSREWKWLQRSRERGTVYWSVFREVWRTEGASGVLRKVAGRIRGRIRRLQTP